MKRFFPRTPKGFAPSGPGQNIWEASAEAASDAHSDLNFCDYYLSVLIYGNWTDLSWLSDMGATRSDWAKALKSRM